MTCCIALTTVTVDSVAFADHTTATVSNAEGSSVPGCEETNECFIPHIVTIDEGDKVTWTNPDTAAHTITSGSTADGFDGVFDSGLLSPGVEFSHTFEEAGEYPYFCLVHPWMKGLVVVQSDVDEPSQTQNNPVRVSPTITEPPDHMTTEVINAEGSSVPGCEETNECFIPHIVTIDEGDKVTWTNPDTAAHTITSGSTADGFDGVFDSGLLSPGVEFSHTFEEAGEYPYFCLVHPWMKGLVVVQSDVDESSQMQSHPERVSPAAIELSYLEDQIYTNAELSLSINLPRGWVIQDTDDENTLIVADLLAGNIIQSFMTVSMVSAPGVTIDDVVDEGAGQAIFAELAKEGTLEMLQQQRDIINGMPAFVADAVVHPDNVVGSMAIKYRTVIVVSTDAVHMFVFGSLLGSFDATLPQFEESLHSFQVLEGYADDDTVSLSELARSFAAFMALAALITETEGALIAEYGLAPPIYTVSSGSMQPVLEAGDLIAVSALVGFDRIGPGDIIVYNRPSDHDRVIVHRVVSVIDNDPYTLRAKGDANPLSIYGTDFPITEDDYIGKVINIIRHHNASEISSDDDPLLGMAGAPTEIILFSDFQCPSCIRFHAETLPVLTEQYLDMGLARLIYRDFPDIDTYPNAVNAAAAAECADDQNLYWEYHDILSNNAREWGILSRTDALAQFESYAEAIELDRSDFLKCINGGKYIPEVISDYTDGAAYGVYATPMLFVGNTHTGYYQISGSRPYVEIQTIIYYVLGKSIRDVAAPSGDTTYQTVSPVNFTPQAGDAVVILNTEQGRLVLEFFPEDIPHHVNNFVMLAKDSVYTGLSNSNVSRQTGINAQQLSEGTAMSARIGFEVKRYG